MFSFNFLRLLNWHVLLHPLCHVQVLRHRHGTFLETQTILLKIVVRMKSADAVTFIITNCTDIILWQIARKRITSNIGGCACRESASSTCAATACSHITTTNPRMKRWKQNDIQPLYKPFYILIKAERLKATAKKLFVLN